MKEFIVVFQMGDVSYLQGTESCYTATIKQFDTIDEKTKYWLVLHDQVLIDKFGKHHDYFYNEEPEAKSKNYAEFSTGNIPDIMDLHKPVMKAIEAYRKYHTL